MEVWVVNAVNDGSIVRTSAFFNSEDAFAEAIAEYETKLSLEDFEKAYEHGELGESAEIQFMRILDYIKHQYPTSNFYVQVEPVTVQ
jgi:hypothetical protein